MRINLRDLSLSELHEIPFEYSISFLSEEVNYQTPFQSPVLVAGRVYDNYGSLILEGAIDTTVHVHCARCYKPFCYDRHVDFSFLLSRDLEAEESDELLVLESDVFELDEIVLSELVLSMNMADVCRDDCKGVCLRCGRDLNEGDCGCETGE